MTDKLVRTQSDDNKHQESQRSNLEEKFQQEEDKLEVEERQTKESLEGIREQEEKDEMKEEEELLGEEENKPENREARDDVKIASRDVERETIKGKEERETIGSISEASAVINKQILNLLVKKRRIRSKTAHPRPMSTIERSNNCPTLIT